METNELISWPELDSRLATAAANFLDAVLSAAKARAGEPELIEALDRLAEVKLVVHADGPALQLELLCPSADGNTLRLYGFVANEFARVAH